MLRANPRFQRFWLARLLSHAAQNAILLALLVTVVNETGSTIHSSLLVLTFVLPSAFLGLLGGVVVDRLPKREVLVTTSLFRAALSLVFIRAGSGVASIYLTNLAVAAITQVAAPAESATLPSLVPEGQLVSATAALNLEVVVSQVLGTVLLAPLLVKTVGLRPLFALTALSFSAASLLYWRLPAMDPEAAPGDQNQATLGEVPKLHDLRGAASDAWTLVWSDRDILTAVVLQTLVATTVVVLISILPVYTRNVLHLNAEYSVAVFSPAALGMLLALRIVPHLSRRFSKPVLVSLAFVQFVALLAALGLTRQVSLVLQAHVAGHVVRLLASRIGLSAILAAPLGFAYGVVGVAARALLYERVPAAMQGRVFALLGVVGAVASILPLIVVGLIASWLGPQAVLVLVAAVDIAIAWCLGRLFGTRPVAGPGRVPPGADERG
jgi:MFS family permease